MGVCVVNGSDLQTTKQLHVTRLQLQKRETLNAFFTARTDRLPCTRAVMYMQLSNHNLTIQANYDEWYSRSIVFNVYKAKGHTESLLQALFGKTVHTLHIFTSVKLQEPHTKISSVRLCIVHRTVCWSLQIHTYWTLFLIRYSTALITSVLQVHRELPMRKVECYEWTNWLSNMQTHIWECL